jgi:hypothetical protein
MADSGPTGPVDIDPTAAFEEEATTTKTRKMPTVDVTAVGRAKSFDTDSSAEDPTAVDPTASFEASPRRKRSGNNGPPVSSKYEYWGPYICCRRRRRNVEDDEVSSSGTTSGLQFSPFQNVPGLGTTPKPTPTE